MATLNLGILAHVDAGKTSLTERLLYTAGVIDAIGSVDSGSTQTDSLALERQRGITIKSAVVSFVVDSATGPVTVNLIDTPGHPDFIAEVERVLSVLDGAVLVISAVEGVQAQTRILLRTLQRLRIPTLIFINKIDRGGADRERVLRNISERLTPAVVPMGATRGLGGRDATFVPYGADDADFTRGLLDLLSSHDDALLAAYVADESGVPYRRLRRSLAAQTGWVRLHPVYFGSAITGAGIPPLIAGITELLPAVDGDPDGPVSGTVFKIDRGAAGEKLAYVRMFSGTVRTRDRVRIRDGDSPKVTGISVFDRGAAVPRPAVVAGEIGRLRGLADVRIGDPVGVPRTPPTAGHFAPPTLETAVVARRPAELGALHAALAQLAEQDPLINLRQDDVRRELFLSLYGEVQKEVIQQTLAAEFGIDVDFRETTTICVERPVGTGTARDLLGAPDNPFVATVGLRVAPAAAGTGVSFQLDAKVGPLPLYVYKAVDEFRTAMADTVAETLRQGLRGWPVTDCAVTMTDSDYLSPESTARDFRLLTPLVLMDALRQAGTVVCEPIHRFHLEVPADLTGTVLPALGRLHAVVQATRTHGSTCVLEGDVPAARVHGVHQRVPGLTRGEGVLECVFHEYRPVHGPAPTRPRTDHNPLHRKEYLLQVVRRAAGHRDGR